MTISEVTADERAVLAQKQRRRVKCVIWDLDNTLWDGILLEGDAVSVRPGLRDVIEALDQRGVLNSIASRNDHDAAMAKLEEFGLAEYFLWPQINWDSKSESIRRIAERINISVDACAFIDDQPFERDEVQLVHPRLRCLDAVHATTLLDVLELRDEPVTEESTIRRRMYRAEQSRKTAEETFVGPSEAFLATLGMVVTISTVRDEDLERAEELTIRTNQLNSTGRPYSREELEALLGSPNHRLLVVGLDDKYGTYGRIGLVLLELAGDTWTLKLLLMSCRVMSRGIGTVLLHHVMHEAKRAGVQLLADFVRTEYNRVMLITYRFAGFRDHAREGDVMLLKHDLADIPSPPEYIELVIS